MKRFIMIVGMLLAAVLCTAAAAPQETFAAQQTAREGNFSGAAEEVLEDGALTGYRLTGAAEFSESVPLDGFYSNFIVPQGASAASAALKKDGETLATFTFEFGQDTFSGSVTFAQGAPVAFGDVAYRNGREVQYRIGREQRVSLEDGSVDYLWTFRANAFAKRFAAGDAEESFLAQNQTAMVRYSANVSPSADVQTVGEYALYDYAVIENGVQLRANTLSFERFDFLWQIPEGYGHKGFIVRRYIGEDLDETITISSPSVGSLSQTRMLQGTAYTYKIYAYDDTNVSTTPCPKVLFRFSDFTVTTREGSLGVAIGVGIGIVAALAAVIVLYTFWYQLPIRRKANESACKPKKV